MLTVFLWARTMCTCIRVCVTESTVRCVVCDKGSLGGCLFIGVLHHRRATLNAQNCCTPCLWFTVALLC